MPFIIGAILMTQLKAFKSSAKKGVEEAIEREEKIDEKLEYNYRDKIDFMRDEDIEKKYKAHKEKEKQT